MFILLLSSPATSSDREAFIGNVTGRRPPAHVQRAGPALTGTGPGPRSDPSTIQLALRPHLVTSGIARLPQMFRYQVDKKFYPLLLVFGVRPSKDGVSVTEGADGGSLEAKFAFFRLVTSLANIDGAHITRGYRWWTAVGARMSFVDDGLTFGTNHLAGVCIHFVQKVPSLLKRKGHSALTVTVADLDGLVATLGGQPSRLPDVTGGRRS